MAAYAIGLRDDGDRTQMRLGMNPPRWSEFAWTHRWRRQSAANSSRKWSSESQVFGVPTGKWAFSPGDRPIYAIVITLIFRMQVLPRRLIFPSIKERGGSTRSKFVQNVRLFSQLRFKTHNIGSLATTINRGYCGRDTRLNCGAAPFRVVIGCGKNHAETRPQETPLHPERPTRGTRNEGPFVLSV